MFGLETKIKRRKKEAKKKKIFEKAQEICFREGESDSSNGRYISDDYEFEERNLTIKTWKTDFDFGLQVSIKYNQKEVYSAISNGSTEKIDNYAPGKWEEQFDKIYSSRILPEIEKEKQTEKKMRKTTAKQEKEDLKAKWGL